MCRRSNHTHPSSVMSIYHGRKFASWTINYSWAATKTLLREQYQHQLEIMSSIQDYIAIYRDPGPFGRILEGIFPDTSKAPSPPKDQSFTIGVRRPEMYYPKPPKNPSINGVVKSSYNDAWKYAPTVTKANMGKLKLDTTMVYKEKFPDNVKCSHLRLGATECMSGTCFFLGVEDEHEEVRRLEVTGTKPYHGAQPKVRKWDVGQMDLIMSRRVFINGKGTAWIACVEDC
ncbi:hypothetical protein BU26DRAFT_339601 [Trematosphaeria pertusa]|uniref:Uncharacterized protein n=1 Tax=Trematosphaeria pertusa TaxID=390896 RepID=A0A6A6I9F4_9PLEO|nr:uncharacterized protein BU26DRAFT_339601 [Trematosphaeria pertusa]KAF2247016.1 hypothetical protein BU26DRAFT_339601 [Trematosphaeria pertusa]